MLTGWPEMPPLSNKHQSQDSSNVKESYDQFVNIFNI